MCGLAGYVSKNHEDVDRELLTTMTRLVSHRGPDGEGYFISRNVGLGHRRLAILDLTPKGAQPMTRTDTGLTIIHNGEIYNYIELRQELERQGERFTTHTDTEVILAAYDKWGPRCVERFNGMWAFAILDTRRNTIFCSRDRFGIKPFYYLDAQSIFLFGSELRQLVSGNPKAPSPDEEIVRQFLVTGACDYSDRTFFSGAKKLPAGHNLHYCTKTNTYSIERYYEMTVDQSVTSMSMSASIARFSELFASAVSLRLRSDVPVGTCLSGGLDSSSIAVLAAGEYMANRPEPFRGITAISEQSDNDESAYAKEVVKKSGMQWITVRPVYKDFVAVLPMMVEAQEEPFPDPSVCMQFFVMSAAKKNNISVLLDGQGGDETLLGYKRYYATQFLDVRRRNGWRCALSAMVDARRNSTDLTLLRLLGEHVYFTSANVRYRYYRWRNRYLTSAGPIPAHLIEFASAQRDIHALQKLDIETNCLPALLRYEDKNSMWHSIETRLPFLDYRLVEFAISLSSAVKIRQGWRKYVLREAMKDKLPSEVVWRRDKIGFEAPVRKWLDAHVEVMEGAVLSSPLVCSLSRKKTLAGIFRKLDRRTRWRLYSVALWEQRFL